MFSWVSESPQQFTLVHLVFASKPTSHDLSPQQVAEHGMRANRQHVILMADRQASKCCIYST